jgi:DNA helicase-2/ATP-dependent DNA helicase PcrA
MSHPAVTERLARLAPDQRAPATAPPGPVLGVAPAGSGKTTTLIARVAWLVSADVDPATIAAIAFNRRAAEELAERLDVVTVGDVTVEDLLGVLRRHPPGQRVQLQLVREGQEHTHYA